MNRIGARASMAIAVVGIAAVSLSGCGSSASSADSTKAHAAINAAATKSMRQGSAQVTMNTSQSMNGTKTSTSAAGVVAFDGSIGRLLMVLPQAKSRVEEMVVDNTVYLRMESPSFPSSIQNKWIKTSLNDVKTLKSLGFSGLPPVGSILGQLAAVGGTAKYLGDVSVADKPFSKYQITVSRADLIQNAEKAYGASSASVTALKAAPADTHATIVIYVSKAGLISREIESMSIPVSGKTATSRTEISLANYGTPISKTPPASKGLIDGPSLFVTKK